MKIIQGNLLDLFDAGEFNVIAHGCNCFCTMGSGIAAQIRQRYPRAYEVDNIYSGNPGDINKLGGFTKCARDLTIDSGMIYNLYTQYEFGGDKVHLNYDALALCLYKLNFEQKGKRVGLPMIGCGLAGGDPVIVKEIIENRLTDCDVTLVEYNEKN